METTRLTGDDWQTLRDVRLAALADAPYAYGSTLAVEQGFDESTWRDRIDTALWVLAVHDAENAGLVGNVHVDRDVGESRTSRTRCR
jgi:hypothetical protein